MNKNEFFSMTSLSPSDCENDGKPEMARLAPKTSILPLPFVGRSCPRAISLSSGVEN